MLYRLDMCDSDTEWAWFAGFFDGEGCVRVSEVWRKSQAKNGGPKRYSICLVLHIVQVDRAPLERVLRIAQTGHIKERKKYKGWKENWKTSYEWQAGGALQIKPILENLRRFTVLKTPQIDAALELISSYGVRGCNGKHNLNNLIVEKRQKIVAKIKKLKQIRICDIVV